MDCFRPASRPAYPGQVAELLCRDLAVGDPQSHHEPAGLLLAPMEEAVPLLARIDVVQVLQSSGCSSRSLSGPRPNKQATHAAEALAIRCRGYSPACPSRSCPHEPGQPARRSAVAGLVRQRRSPAAASVSSHLGPSRVAGLLSLDLRGKITRSVVSTRRMRVRASSLPFRSC